MKDGEGKSMQGGNGRTVSDGVMGRGLDCVVKDVGKVVRNGRTEEMGKEMGEFFLFFIYLFFYYTTNPPKIVI